MRYIFLLSILIQNNDPIVIFNFNSSSNIRNWQVVDDGVMGGVSKGNFILNDEGNGYFSGNVSLDNNGGFSSLRYTFSPISIAGFEYVKLTIKGDGGKFNFRVKENARDYYSFAKEIDSSGDWEEVMIPLKELAPVFRGQLLNMPRFQGEQIEQLSILRANKKHETFTLQIKKIELTNK